MNEWFHPSGIGSVLTGEPSNPCLPWLLLSCQGECIWERWVSRFWGNQLLRLLSKPFLFPLVTWNFPHLLWFSMILWANTVPIKTKSWLNCVTVWIQSLFWNNFVFSIGSGFVQFCTGITVRWEKIAETAIKGEKWEENCGKIND